MQPTNQPKVFISYSWKPESNRQWVEMLARKLVEDEFKDTALNLYVQYNDLQRSQGLMTMEQQSIMTNRIRNALLNLFGQIEMEDLNVAKAEAYLQR